MNRTVKLSYAVNLLPEKRFAAERRKGDRGKTDGAKKMENF